MLLPTKTRLIFQILAYLFDRESKRLEEEIERVHKLNQEAHGVQLDGFMFKGENFVRFKGRGQRKSLHISLNPIMGTFLRDRSKVREDQESIKQMIHLLIEDCENLQDIRDALPECIVNLVDGLNKYNRTNEAAYTIIGNERALRNYEKVLPRMQFYAMARMLY